MTDDLFEGAPYAGGAVGVDGENDAVKVVGADHAEGTFDELPVTGFALAEGGLGRTLGGDVDAGSDDEANLSLVVDQGSGGPGDAAKAAVAVEPAVLEDGRKRACTQAIEGLDGLGDVLAGNELVPGIAADKRGEVISGCGLAGAVEADDAAGGVEDDHQCAYGIKDGGDEVTFDGEGRFDSLAGTSADIDLTISGVELEAGDDLTAENRESAALRDGECARRNIEDQECADADSFGRREGAPA